MENTQTLSSICIQLGDLVTKIEQNSLKINEVQKNITVLAGQGFNVQASLVELTNQKEKYDTYIAGITEQLQKLVVESETIAKEVNQS